MLVCNGFTLAYGGDYSGQYIPMGYHIWDYYHGLFSNGQIKIWDESIFLGASTIGSNAYYGLYSPFNIIIIIFPREIVPQMLAISSLIKTMVAGLIFRTLLKYYGTKEITARLGGIAYAFIGWMAFYLWYNNYQDTYVFFPLLLLGIEILLKEKKPWVLSIGIFLLSISNYVLMVTYAICGVCYAAFRYFQKIKTRNLEGNIKIIGIGIFAFGIGILMSGAILVPALVSTLKSPKVSSSTYWSSISNEFKSGNFWGGISYIFDWGKATDQHGAAIPIRSYYPILNFFFPATTNRSMATLEFSGVSQSWDFDDLSCSLWVYVPYMLFLVPALMESIKNKRISHVIAVVLITFSLCTPIMYYLFMGAVNAYARWTLFATASLIIYVSLYIDKIPNINKKFLHFGLAFAVLGIVACWILTSVLPSSYKGEGSRGLVIHRLVYNDFDFTNLAFSLELVYVIVLYIFIYFNINKKKLFTILTSMVCFEAVLMGNFVTMGHGFDTTYNNGYSKNNELYSLVNQIKQKDPQFYRIYTSTNDAYSVNNGMMNGYSSPNFFHSLYNFNVNYFSQWSRIRYDDKSVGGTYRGKIQDLDTFLGVKYYIIDKGFDKSRADAINEAYNNNFEANVPLGFIEGKSLETKTFKVFYNPNFSDFGYSYKYIYNYNNEGDTTYTNIKAPQFSHNEYDIVHNSVGFEKSALLSYEDYIEVLDNSNGDISTLSYDYIPSTLHMISIDGNDYQIKFYKTDGLAKEYPLKDITSIPTTLEETTYESKDNMKYFAFITRKNGECFEGFNDGEAFYIYAPFSGSEKYDIYFIDEDNRIFLYDDHDDHSTDNPSPIRGFYTQNKKVKAIAYCGKYANSGSMLRISYERGSEYLARLNSLNENPITDVTYSNDKYTFKTNYDQHRFVVSKIAYDNGWRLYSTTNGVKEEVKTYNGMGGFVSFLAKPGEYTYELVYETPYGNSGRIIGMISFTIFITSLLVYQYYTFEKNKKLFSI